MDFYSKKLIHLNSSTSPIPQEVCILCGGGKKNSLVTQVFFSIEKMNFLFHIKAS